MTLIKTRILLPGLLLLTTSIVFAQKNTAPRTPATPPQKDAQPQKPPAAKADAGQPKTDKKPDQAAAYNHFALAHMYEEMMSMYGRSEYATKAIEEYRLAIENDPSSEYLNASLAELYAKTGRIRDAVLEAQEIIKIEPKNADNHLLLGRLYFLNKDAVKAETEFKSSLNLDPNSEEAITNLAYLYNDEGANNKAADLLKTVPEGQRSAKIYSALGTTYEQQKDYKNAIASFRQALAMDKENLDAMRGLAQNLANDNQIDAALDEYRTIQDADPQDATAALRVAEIYRRQGKFDLAMENLKKAAALVQESLEIPYNEALILEAQGKYEESATILQKLVSHPLPPDARAGDTSNRALFLERLGHVYREAGRPLLAMETFR